MDEPFFDVAGVVGDTCLDSVWERVICEEDEFVGGTHGEDDDAEEIVGFNAGAQEAGEC